MKKNTRILCASSLTIKWGFNDGAILGSEIRGYADEAPPLYNGPESEEEVLEELVRTHLLPLLPGIEIYHVETSHNPIRTDQILSPEQEKVFAMITEEDAMAAAARVAKRRLSVTSPA